jgi:methylated-DNA-[protein]-cysteine S-methyltransferase
MEIPFGKIKTYGDIARDLGNIKPVRVVGLTNGKNKLGIVIPCHRVIGSNNRLIGYGGSLIRKDWLLKHEKRYSGQEYPLDIFIR